ncbi:MAG TPA: tetratricopeptide repeat protein [Candidatus Angelobacter sp.]|nr:tetratricopeptide repeat protein [Candidatus Angelobacter sp.]
MKRLFGTVVLLLALICSVRANGPDDDYVQIYNLIQEGDTLATNQPAQALAKYNDAQTALRRFQKNYPGWNDRVVNFRLNYLSSKITILSAKASGATNAPVASSVPPSSATTTSVPAPAAVQAPAKTAPQTVGPSASELQNQIAELQNELRQLQGDKSLLEAKLREALAARPAGADPREYAKAQEKIRTIEKENELLQVSLAQEKEKVAAALSGSTELQQTKDELADTKRQLAEQTARASQLAQQNESLQAQIKTLTASNAELASLRSENAALKKTTGVKLSSGNDAELSKQLADAQATIASLQADKDVWRLEKEALQNRVKQLSTESTVAGPSTAIWTQDSAHVKQLERERDELQKKLDAAQRELYGRNGKETAARVDELANELEGMRARLDVYESKPVPYTAEELALFKKPETRVADAREGEKPARELPKGTIELVASAQEDFSRKSYEQAEQKYEEVLQRDDKNVNTLANLATIQLEMGHLDDAEKNIKAALALAPNDAFSLSILGNLRFRQAKYNEALDALSRAAKLDPKNAEIQNFLGLALSEKGMRNAAETAFRKAVLLNPNYGGAQNNLAVFYLTQQPPSIELARWHYDKAIASGFPRNPDMEKALDEKEKAQSADAGH